MSKRFKGQTPPTHAATGELVLDAEDPARAERDPIDSVADLGRAFVAWLKDNPDERSKSGRVRISVNDEYWAGQPLALPNSWHQDKATKWNFNVFQGRLVEATSNDAMARGAR